MSSIRRSAASRIFSIEQVSCDLRGCVATSDQSRRYFDLATSLSPTPPSSQRQHTPEHIPRSRLLSTSAAMSSRLFTEEFMYEFSSCENRTKLANGRT